MKKLILFLAFFSILAFTKQVEATTHYVQIGVSTPNYCVDTLALDTFVILKPAGYGTTQWYIDFIPQGVYDSLIFIPSSIGNYSISANWNGISAGIGLHLFGAPPAHTTLSVTSGGYLNATNDTIWKCGSGGVSFSPTPIGPNPSGDTYMEWNGPSSFFSTSASITALLPGIYIFERGNPCGVTYDSVLVVELPINLPTWGDTSFCNSQLNLTLDAGSGWDNYTWSTSETSQSILADTLLTNTTVTYTVITSNICATDTTSIVVEQWNFPTPNLTQFNLATPFCADTVLALNPSPGFTYDSYDWSWDFSTSTDSTLYIK